jgi:hypothetical protein
MLAPVGRIPSGGIWTRTPIKLTLFGLGLLALFAASWGAGAQAGPAPAVTAEHESGEHDTGHSEVSLPGGLQVVEDGYRLELLSPALTTGTASPLRVRVVGPDGSPVVAYTPTHDKDLHLVVVRRDLTGFQHVHPALGPEGVWEIPLRVPAAGQYRVFADFQPAGRDRPLTLGADLPAAGDYRPAPAPVAASVSTVDGYTVTLEGELVAGASAALALSITRDGAPVTDLEPYLAAYGHLVALRAGDLAYLHVHPDGTPGDGRAAPGPRIAFHVEVPSVGTYGLFLDFQHQGVVHTAVFTAVAGEHE